MMMVNQTTKRWHVIGITSAGIGCALPKLPGLYTRVSSYGPWISKTIELMERTSALSKPINLPSTNVTTSNTSSATTTTSPNTTAKPVSLPELVVDIALNESNPSFFHLFSTLNKKE